MVEKSRPSNKKIAAFILYIVCIIFAIVFVVNMFKDTGESQGINGRRHTFSFKGHWPIIVVTGSMEPNIKINSLSICKEATIDEIEIGDIVAYRFRNELITHRVIDKIEYFNGEIGLVTKGDNNPNQDRFDVTKDMVEGKVVKTWNSVAPVISKYMLGPGEINYMEVVRSLIWLVVSIFVIAFAIYWVAGYITMKHRLKKNEDNFQNSLDDYICDIYKLLEYNKKLCNIRDKEINKDTPKLNKISNKLAKIIIMREIRENNESIKSLLRVIDGAEKINKWFDKK